MGPRYLTHVMLRAANGVAGDAAGVIAALLDDPPQSV
jgi:hypothetical protein